MLGFFRDWREESFLLILANFLWVAASVPGWLVLAYGALGRDLPVIGLGLILLIPWPFFTFAVQSFVADLSRGRPVTFRSFFATGWGYAGSAYVWGAANLALAAIVASNLRYYGSGASPLGSSLAASLIGSLLLTLGALWSVWQLFALAVFPHLARPGLRTAWKASMELILARPAVLFVTALVSAAIAILGVSVPPIGLLFGFAAIVALTNRTVVEARRNAG